jgi:hypothetical protein
LYVETCAAGGIGSDDDEDDDDDEKFIQKKVAAFGEEMADSRAELDSLTGQKRSLSNESVTSPNYYILFLQSEVMPQHLKQRIMEYPEGRRNQLIVDLMTGLGNELQSDSLVEQIAKAPFKEHFAQMAHALTEKYVSKYKATKEQELAKFLKLVDDNVASYRV